MYKLINPQGNEKCFKSVYEPVSYTHLTLPTIA